MVIMKDFEYITIFSSEIKPLVSEDKDKYLAMASLVDVGDFIPELDTETNVDLLPIAFNACVINRANKNDDVVDTEHGIAMAKHFINKPINIEHNRDRVVGTILTAGYSEFGTDKPLTEQQVNRAKYQKEERDKERAVKELAEIKAHPDWMDNKEFLEKEDAA